eukprot:EG_transcript_31053
MLPSVSLCTSCNTAQLTLLGNTNSNFLSSNCQNFKCLQKTLKIRRMRRTGGGFTGCEMRCTVLDSGKMGAPSGIQNSHHPKSNRPQTCPTSQQVSNAWSSPWGRCAAVGGNFSVWHRRLRRTRRSAAAVGSQTQDCSLEL